MKTFKNMAAQGELLFVRVDSMPDNVVPASVEHGQYVVGHSETGHHHVLEADGVEMFHVAANDDSIDPFVSYLKVSKPVELRHLRSFDTHEALGFVPGIYRINRQREYTSEGFRRAID